MPEDGHVEVAPVIADGPETGADRACSHNMVSGVLHGAFFHMATAFGDPHAVIPLFLAGFTESLAMIGLVVSLVLPFINSCRVLL